MLSRLAQRVSPRLRIFRTIPPQKMSLRHTVAGLEASTSPLSPHGLASTAPENDEFFRCTTQRWIWNEEQQLAMRYKPFNVSALKQVACDASGATICTSMIKLAEGSFNKIFLLKFDNGEESIARIPCPGAGSERLILSSEVATLDFVRYHLNISIVPRVLTWSADGIDSGVGTGYIIMEKLPGVPLSDRWSTLAEREAWNVMLAMIPVEKTIGSIQFSQIGSLYFKEDVPDELKSRRLYAEGIPDDDASDKYRIGPTTEYNFWRGERKDLNIDRGPWPDFHSYAIAAVERERRWLTSSAHAHASDRLARLNHEHVPPEVHHQLLDNFLTIVQDLKIPTEFTSFILWHPDLHRANLMVREDGLPEIIGLLDWQHTWIGPRFLHILYTPAFRCAHVLINSVDVKSTPSLPDDFDTFDPRLQEHAREELRMVKREHLYLQYTCAYDRPRFDVLHSPLYPPMATPFHQLSDIWPNGANEFLLSLAKLSRNWDLVGKPDSQCPLSFSDAEMGTLLEEEECIQERETMIQVLCNNAGIGLNGGVDPEHYEDAKECLKCAKEDAWVKEYGPWFAEDGARSSLL